MSSETSAPPMSAQPARRKRAWVGRSSAASIARGDISMLALAEIPIAMALYWGIATLSSWPWLTVLGLMAAPALILVSAIQKNLGLSADGADSRR